MKRKTANLAFCAIIAAVISAVMAASYFPFLTYAVPAVAGVIIVIPLVEVGKGYAFLTYLATFIPVMLFAENEAKLFYVCLFGYYPILKAILEKIKLRILEYILKFAVFNGAVSVVYFVFAKLFMINVEEFGNYGKYGIIVLYVLGNIAFLLYDICVSKMCGFYMFRLHHKIKKIMKF